MTALPVDEVLGWVAEVTGARRARRGERIQSLWSGYGEIFRVDLDGGPAATAVVKWVRPPSAARDAIGDARKRRSYGVEAAFYEDVAPGCAEPCRVARCFGSRDDDDGTRLLVLEDLDAAGFVARQRRVEGKSLDACLAWLAAFHARYLGARTSGRWPRLWPVGTYWHLATRTSELDAIDDPALREAAPRIDALLEGSRFTTLVHGDAKEANFCFSRDGRAVAAVDFQYVGAGCPMKDVAYLLHGRPDEPSHEAGRHAPCAALDAYFVHLRAGLDARASHLDASAVEDELRRLYPVARLDFCRFLAGWAPEHWGGDARSRRFVEAALRDGTLGDGASG